ncbi:hypothetical protein VTI74DRAFT_8967 [Chaetomium olivicolor]
MVSIIVGIPRARMTAQQARVCNSWRTAVASVVGDFRVSNCHLPPAGRGCARVSPTSSHFFATSHSTPAPDLDQVESSTLETGRQPTMAAHPAGHASTTQILLSRRVWLLLFPMDNFKVG